MVKLGSQKVVVGTNSGRASLNSIKNLIKTYKIPLAILVVLIIGGVVLAISLNKSPKPQPYTPKYKPPVSTKASVKNEQQISSLLNQHKLSQAEVMLQAQVTQTKAEGDYVTLANVQLAEHKFKAAGQSLQSAEKIYGSDYILSQALATLAIQQGNTKSALDYYQQALASLQKNPGQVSNPTATIANLNTIIAELQKASK